LLVRETPVRDIGATKRRRCVLALLALAMAGRPGVPGAQPSTRVRRIGYLGPPVDTAPHLLKAFQDGLRDVGYVEGRNVTVDYRWTAQRGALLSDTALLANARELIALKPDVFAASIDVAILAARQVAGTTPIVMMNVSDPVALGLLDDLAHPGGNITGLTRLSSELISKNLELLVETVPGATRLAMLVSPPGLGSLTVTNARQAAGRRGLPLDFVEVKSARDLDAAFAAIRRGGAEALIVPGSGVFFAERARIAELALAQRLPAVFAYTENVEAGGLLAYSASSADNYRRAGGFIDKILRGTKPGDIPVEQPTKFELAINLRTARSMGIVFPRSVLLRADRVVE